MSAGKKFREKVKLVEQGKFYPLGAALGLLKKTTVAKFDETVDMAIKLNVDTKKNPSVRGTISLPEGSGKSKKVAVITRPELVKDAEAAGADVAGSVDLADRIKEGFLDFDILIATPDMMGTIGKLGKVLGPKGLMPNPKTGTVTEDIIKAVKEFKGGKIEFKMDKGGVIHTILGKSSFPETALKKNFQTAISAINHAKPSGTKGAFVQTITISSTMGPGIKVDAREALAEAA